MCMNAACGEWASVYSRPCKRCRIRKYKYIRVTIARYRALAQTLPLEPNTLTIFNFPITIRQFILSKLNRVNVCLFVSTFLRNIIAVFHVTEKLFICLPVGMSQISGNRKQCSIDCCKIAMHGTRNFVDWTTCKIQSNKKHNLDSIL